MGSPRLDRRHADEADNYRVSVERLGETLLLVDEFDTLYGALRREVEATGSLSNELWIVSIYFLAAQAELIKATSECLRGSLTDALQTTRRAIEVAAFGWRVAKNPHLAEVWMQAGTDEEAYQQYRDKFSGEAKIFPKNHTTLSELRERYDVASRMLHGSPQSVSGRTVFHHSDTHVHLEFLEFESGRNHPSDVPRTFLWIIHTHQLILHVFFECFGTHIGAVRRKQWRAVKAIAEARLESEKRRWYRVTHDPGAIDLEP